MVAATEEDERGQGSTRETRREPTDEFPQLRRNRGKTKERPGAMKEI